MSDPDVQDAKDDELYVEDNSADEENQEEEAGAEEDDEVEYVVPPLPYVSAADDDEGQEFAPSELSPIAPEAEGGVPRWGWGAWIVLSVVTVIVAWFMQVSVFQVFTVPSASMEPKIQVGDVLLVNKAAYGLFLPEGQRPLIRGAQPARGDVVIIARALADNSVHGGLVDEYLVKRIAALPGDRVAVTPQDVLVNGVSHRNGRVKEIKAQKTFTLPKGSYYVIGDNFDHSEDSRVFGPVERGAIVGKVWGIVFSARGTKRFWQRVGPVK